MRKFQKRLSTVALAAVAALITGCSASGSVDGNDDTVELTKLSVSPVVIGPTYWPFYFIPQSLGYYEDEGLDVEILPLNAGVTQALLTDQIDIGGAGFEFLAQAADIDQLAWYMMTDKFIFAPMVRGDSPVQSIADLAGARIGINETRNEVYAEFVLTAGGVAKGDYELVPLGEAAPAAMALDKGEVDAIIIPANQSYLAALEAAPDADIRIVEPEAFDRYYNTGLMANKDFLTNDRETALAFGRAIAKGMIWLHENPRATAEMILELEPDAAADLDDAIAQVSRSAEWNKRIYDERGVIDAAVLQDEVDLLVALGLLDTAYDVSRNVDTSFAEEIWASFDVEAEIELARAGNWRRD